jgi:hypothetical protein
LGLVLWHFLRHIEVISVEPCSFTLATLATNEALTDLTTARCATTIVGVVDLVRNAWQL